jgi:hypothetical protein
MQVINSQNKRDEKHKLIAIPWTNFTHMIVEEVDRSQHAEIKQLIHDDQQQEVKTVSTSGGKASAQKPRVDSPVSLDSLKHRSHPRSSIES